MFCCLHLSHIFLFTFIKAESLSFKSLNQTQIYFPRNMFARQNQTVWASCRHTDDSDDHTPGMSWSDLCQSWSLFHCQSTPLNFLSSLSINTAADKMAVLWKYFKIKSPPDNIWNVCSRNMWGRGSVWSPFSDLTPRVWMILNLLKSWFVLMYKETH